MKHQRIYHLVSAALIAAMYTALSLVFAPVAYGPVQFRASEALTVLPVFTPVAIPGLAVGCLLSNLIGLAMGRTVVWDLLFGTLATLTAAVLTYVIGKTGRKAVAYWLAPLPPVLVNAVVVGWEITLFFAEGNASLIAYWFHFGTVFLGQLAVCYGLGVPLLYLLGRNRLAERIFRIDPRE